MSWTVTRTASFDKWWKKEKVSEENFEYFQPALADFRNITLPHNVQTRIFENARYECWVTRLPDKIRRQGKSGGFRVVFILDKEEGTLLLQGIFRRDHLSWHAAAGKHNDAYEELLRSLAQDFIEIA